MNNPKLLFLGTMALALVSSLALAEEAKPLTRADVVAEYQRAAAGGTLHRTEQDDVAGQPSARSGRMRSEVVADMDASRKANTLVGPMRNRNYNSYGSELLRPSNVARSDVKAQVGAAIRDGSLRRSDYDDVPVTVSRRAARERAAAPGRKPGTEGRAG